MYKVIDIENWSRGKLFKHYIDDMRLVMSMTVDIDVTNLLNYVHKNGYRFYPAMIWAVSKVINLHDEFKYSFDEKGDLIKWDSVSPYYTVFHKDDESFTKLCTEYSYMLSLFYQRFVSDEMKYRNERGLDVEAPKNTFDVSCMPWVRYSHFDVHVFDEGKYLAPVVTWGKYEEKDGRMIMPITMNIHHAVADGYHLSRFFLEVQKLIGSLH